jgi:undecaprenyl-diphosphatase
MSEMFVAVILGIVEGLTEFLPISSTGHLILVSHVLKFIGDKANAFHIFIQLGAILAVVGYFRKRIWKLLHIASQPSPEASAASFQPNHARRFIVAILVAFIPAAVIGFLAHREIEKALFNPMTVAVALVVGGVGILLIEKFRPRPITTTMEELSWTQALIVGVAQCLALIPGMSRSASTIMGGLLARLDHAAAAEFSFFLAIPTMFAATFYSLFNSVSILSKADLAVFMIGLIVSLIVAWLVIAAFMAFIKRHSFVVFGWYRIVFGVGLLIFLWQGWM